jgi:hypothetical protein
MKTTALELNYPTREINLDFRIKVYGVDENGKRINKLMGVSGIKELIGVELLNKFLDRAYRLVNDKTVCKLRRGLQVTFYNK